MSPAARNAHNSGVSSVYWYWVHIVLCYIAGVSHYTKVVENAEVNALFDEVWNNHINKKAVLSQRWPRDASYSGSHEPLRRNGHSSILGHMEPPFWGRGGRRGSAMAPFERAMVVFYRLSIVTVALSVTIRPQFAIECLRRSNQQGWVTLGQNFRMFPLE